MKILLIANHCNTGGITSYMLSLSRGLMRRGHQVYLFCTKGDQAALFETAGVKCTFKEIKVKAEIHPKVWLALPALIDLIRREKIELVHAQTRVGQVMAAIAALFTGVSVVSTCHGFFKPRFFRLIFPCWGRGVIAISQGVHQHLLRDFRLPYTKVKLVYNGIDLNQFNVTKRPHEGQVIGIIARLSSVKGIDVLIKAMPSVLKVFSRAKLMIVGEGPEQENLTALVKRMNLSDVVLFKPIFNRTMEVLPSFDVFVMPSLQEGLGLSVMEAQAAGVPVVASNVGGLPDLIDDGRSGLLVPPGQPEALAAKIIFLLQNPALAKDMAQRARLQVSERFNLDKMLEGTISFYEEYLRR